MNKGIIIALVVIVIGAIAFYMYKKNTSNGKPAAVVAPATEPVKAPLIVDEGVGQVSTVNRTA